MPADHAPSVLIAGIHSAHGFAISHRFRLEGWYVIGCDLGTSSGRNARVHITADLTVEPDCRRAVATAAELGNGLDCVVNCADIRLDGPLDEVGSAAWGGMMDVNAKSMFLLAAAAVPYLQVQHGSILAVAPGPMGAGVAEHAVFDASRAALIAFLDSLEIELAPRGVKVHVVMSDEAGSAVAADDIALRVWDLASVDEDGHVRSFAHSH